MILTIIIFILILGLTIFFHELGHFFSAKKFGVAVEEFGFGYPPRIFGIKVKGTLYSLNWIPVGGFVKIKGEAGENKNDKDSFVNKKIWQRAVILSSGVAMNFVLAIIIISIGFYLGLPTVLDNKIPADQIRDEKVQIITVYEDSPAFQAGLEVGDEILSIDNVSVTSIQNLQDYNKDKIGKSVNLKIKRGGQEITKEVNVIDRRNIGRGELGVNLVETGIVSYPIFESVWMGIKTTLFLTWQIIYALFDIIRSLIISKPVAIDVAGPVGIAVITGQVVNMGFIYILQFTALLTINLAIINFFPFPALDGGRVLFLIIEKIRGKAINTRLEATIHNIGFALLLLLVIVVTFRDISRFRESILNFFRNLTGG